MSDVGPIIPLTSGRDFGEKSPDELEAMLDSLTPEGGLPDEVAPEPAPEPEATPELEAAPEPEPEPAPSDDEQPEPEMDLAASEREGDRLQLLQLQADLALQKAHASRLAGEIGFLRNQKPQAASEQYEPQSQAEIDRLALVEQSLADLRAESTASKVSQAVADAVSAMDGTWVEELAEEITAIAPKYADQIVEAKASRDPELARLSITGISLAIKAEAMQARWAKNHAVLVEKKASSRAANDKAKRAAAPSASGGVPALPPKAKTFADYTPQEADEWLRANVC